MQSPWIENATDPETQRCREAGMGIYYRVKQAGKPRPVNAGASDMSLEQEMEICIDPDILPAVRKLYGLENQTTIKQTHSRFMPQNEVTALEQKVENIAKQLEQQARNGVSTIVDQLVSECRLTAAEAPKAIARAVADPTYLDELRARPQML